MAYDYATQRAEVFRESGQRTFLKIRDNASEMLGVSGAVLCQNLFRGVGGDIWTMLACVDRLVELGELSDISRPDVLSQYRVFVKRPR